MKVNMNLETDKKQAPEKSESKKKPARPAKNKQLKSRAPSKEPSGEKPKENSGNVYIDGLKEYADKFKKQLKDGGIFSQNKFWIITAVILFVIFLSVNSNVNNTKTGLRIQIKQAKAETEKLNSAIDEVKADLEEQAKIDSVKLTESEEELARNNAIEQGTTVANLQNAYRYLDIEADYDAFMNNKDLLDACFGDNDKNARTEWYSSLGGIPGTWEFASKASFFGNTAKVLWLCYADEDHTLLSYCTGKYNADTKLFTDVEWKMTSYALAHIKSDSEASSNTGQITSVEESLKKLAESADTSTEYEEFDEETINSNNELSKTRESYKEAVAGGEIEGEEYDSNYNIGLGSSSDSPDLFSEE